VKAHGGIKGLLSDFGRPRFSWTNLFPVALLILFAAMIAQALEWNPLARIVPLIVGSGAIAFCTLALANEVFKKSPQKSKSLEEDAKSEMQRKMHMDIKSSLEHVPVRTMLLRGGIFFGWMVAFLISMATIGIIATVPLFVIAFMRLEARESWRIAVPMAATMCVFIYFLFDQLLAIPWPPTVLADYSQDAFDTLQWGAVRVSILVCALTLGYGALRLAQTSYRHVWSDRKA
jgi:hypothetical protein